MMYTQFNKVTIACLSIMMTDNNQCSVGSSEFLHARTDGPTVLANDCNKIIYNLDHI